MDLEIREFDNAIKSFVEKSPLPDEVKRMILEKRLAEQTEKTIKTIQKQIEERDKKEKEGVKRDAESVR